MMFGSVAMAQTSPRYPTELPKNRKKLVLYDPQISSFLEAGFTANASKTDLAGSYQRWTPGMHLSLQLNRRKRWNGSFNMQMGSVISQNLRPQFTESMSENVSPVKYVQTTFFTLHYSLQLNLIRTESFRLFVGQGIGIIRINPKDNEGNSLLEATRTRNTNETFNRVTIALPTQVGFNYFLSNGYGLGFAASWLHPSTDYVDNLSQLGKRSGNDKILSYKLSLLIPLQRKKAELDQGDE